MVEDGAAEPAGAGLANRRRHFAAGVVTTLVLLGLLVLWVKPEQVWSAVRQCDLGRLAVAFLLTPVVIGIKVARWLLLARSIVAGFSVCDAVRSYLAGLFLATVTPLAAGEAARGFFVSSDSKIELSGKTILEKLVDLASLCAFASIGLLFLGHEWSLLAGIAGLVVFGGFCMVVFGLAPRLRTRFETMRQAKGIRGKLSAVLYGITHTRAPQLLGNIVLALIGFSVYFTQGLLVLRAFYPECPPEVMVVLPVVTLSTILPIGIGGIGVREWSAVVLLGPLGVSDAVASTGTLTHFAIVQIIPAMFGTFFVGRILMQTRCRR